MNCTRLAYGLIKEMDAFFLRKPLPLTNSSLRESLNIGFYAQARMNKVISGLYSFLVPSEEYAFGTLPNPGTTYLKGGKICYKTLDYLNVFCKTQQVSPQLLTKLTTPYILAYLLVAFVDNFNTSTMTLINMLFKTLSIIACSS